MTPTRIASVDGRPIYVFDSLISVTESARLFGALTSMPFTKNEIARPDTDQVRHWALNVSLDEVRKLPIFEPTEAAIAAAEPEQRYRIYRSYCNHASYGDMLFTHTDCLPDQNERTALWFLTPPTWDIEWGGETLFFNEKGDAEVVVSPKPGRLVIFDGAIRHAGRAPSRICYASRFTFAFKLEIAR